MARALGSALILLLLGIDLALPYTPLGRRGSDAKLRHDVAAAVGEVGMRLPDVTLLDLRGRPVRLSEFRGRRVVLTFERNIDW